jgi:hypothetical protein
MIEVILCHASSAGFGLSGLSVDREDHRYFCPAKELKRAHEGWLYCRGASLKIHTVQIPHANRQSLRGTTLSDWRTRWKGVISSGGVLMIGLLLLCGCNAKENVRRSWIYERITGEGRFKPPPPPAPGQMAARGRDAITAGCAHESYANASKGLIVGETGLHEDVFELRDRESFAANAYGMNEALRLETLLHEEARIPGHSAEQADCIDEFAEHLESLTDALAQSDKLQKELDLSAFNNAREQAAEQSARKQREVEHSGASNPR